MFYEHKLETGLRLIAQPLPYLHSVSVGVWCGVGSVKEATDKEAGITHFIEHMLFKGTERRNYHDIASEMDSIGAQINAFTSKECTCYYIKATDDRLEESMDMLGDIVTHSKMDDTELEKEKGVVIEEIRMVDDTPEDLAMEALNAEFYSGHPLSKPILGTEQSVSAFSSDDLRAYMKKHYTADNILISVAGNYDEAKLTEMVSRFFCDLNTGEKSAYPGIPSRPTKRVDAREKDIEQVHVCMAMPGYGARDDEYFPLVVLNNALGGNMSSRLFQRIREEKGLAYSIYSFSSSYKDTGSMGVYTGCNASQVELVIELILEELRNIKKDGISNEEFERSKNQIKGSFILSNESSGARMSSLGKSSLLYGNARSEEETIALLDAVSQDDIRAILPNILDESALCASFVGRDAEKLLKLGDKW